MAVRPIVEIGAPALRRRAANVRLDEGNLASLAELVADMVDTMRSSGGIGIAAPQIGEPLRAAVVEISGESTRYPGMQPFPLNVFFNPDVTVLDSTPQSFWEGCLSVPGLRGLVARPRRIRVDSFDIDGTRRSLVAEGFLATVLQHELDHLDGVLFVDRLTDTRHLATIENYVRFWRDVDSAALEI